MRKTVIPITFKVIASVIAMTFLLCLTGIADAKAAKSSAASPSSDSIRVQFTKSDITLGGADVFKSAPALKIKLLAMEVTNPHGGGTVPAEDLKNLQSNARYVFNMARPAPVVTVKAVHNGRKMAVQMSWDDATEDTEGAIDSFRDGAALMFPVKVSSFNPSPLMGARGEPVNVWQWRADWQAEKDGTRNLDARQPLTDGVHTGPSDAILKSEFPGKPSADATMVEYVSEGYGTLTKLHDQNVTAKGVHKDGKWTVVFLRDLKRADGSDAEFAAGKKTYVNLAVWNGAASDVNGMKSIGIVWTPVMFDAGK
jgi:DMSO reductase family type II enzyme heme b subunit